MRWHLDMYSLRRRARKFTFYFVIVGAICLYVFYPADQKPPVTIVLSATPDPHAPFPGVVNPVLAISSRYKASVMMSLQLECEVNGTWIPWPPLKSNDVTRLENIVTAKWKETLPANTHIETRPKTPPRENTTNLARIHGFMTKEKTGLPKFAERVRTYFEFRNAKDPALKEMAWSPDFRSYPAGTEYVTTAFYLTNQMTSLAVKLGPQPVGH